MSNTPNWQSQADLIHATLGIPVVAFGVAEAPIYSRGSSGHRALSAIAMEIRATWKNPYFGAVPYLEAMSVLDQITDIYGADSAEDIIRYFLANATNWRGDDARRIKAELKEILKKA